MIGFLNDLIDFAQAKFPPNRVVVLLTPVFSAASGWVAVYAAEHTPFLNLSQGELTAVFVAGASVVVPAVYKWLDGWQKHEARKASTLYYQAGGLDPKNLRPGTHSVPVHGNPREVVAQSPAPSPQIPEDVTDEAREAARRRLGYPPQED